MKQVFNTTLLILTLIISHQIHAQSGEVIVIANVDNEELKMSKREIRNLFMGGVSELNLQPLGLTPENAARLVFNTKIIGLTESRIQSYWAQMRFSGRNKPPKQFESVDEIIEYLLTNKDTIAYVPVNTKIPESLTIVYNAEAAEKASSIN
uniref:hypothetical protein n=1 Tax=Ningiella ruwaisensis TaxID=2364274 RepID=UPI00109F4274|nr:hypothetical protein [Ningiella ruwaisensis]